MLKTNLGRRIIFNQRLPMLLPRVEEIMEMGEMMMMMMEMKMVQTYHLIFLRSPTSRTRFDSILNLPRGGNGGGDGDGDDDGDENGDDDDDGDDISQSDTDSSYNSSDDDEDLYISTR